MKKQPNKLTPQLVLAMGHRMIERQVPRRAPCLNCAKAKKRVDRSPAR